MTPAPRRTNRGAILLLALAVACGGEADEASPPRPDLDGPLPPAACDVLVVSLDTVRADFLTFDDAGTAPHLTRLAERGVAFTRAVAGSSWTLPAHVELFTGLAPALHGVHDDQQAIDPRHATLAEHLTARGVRTFGVYTGWFLAAAYGFGRGYEEYASAMAPSPGADRALAERLAAGGEEAWWAADMRAAASWADVTSERAVDRALELVARAAPDERLHLFVHLFDPHHDYIPPPPYDARFDPDYRGPIDGRNWWSNPRVYDPRRDPPRLISDRDLEHVRALYRGEIAWCDAQLGRLLDGLEEAGRLDETLVVVTSDHGEEFFEHGNRGHRQTLYEEVLRVPLLVVPPRGAPAPAAPRVDALVSLADVLPTVLDYVGGPAPRFVWGRSLRPLIEGGDLDERLVPASLGLFGIARDGTHSLAMIEAYHAGTEKLIRRVRLAPDGEPLRVESIEHYDLVLDPGEQAADVDPDRARALWERAEALQTDLRAFAADLPTSPASARRTDARAVFAHELAELGYASDELPGVERVREARWPSAPLSPLPWTAIEPGGR